MKRGESGHVVLVDELLHRLNLGLGSGGRTGGGPSVAADRVVSADGLDVETVPLVVEGTVHVDAAVARIVTEDAVAVPVGAFHTEVGELSRGLVAGLAAVDGGDEAVTGDIGVGIAEGNAVTVEVAGAQVGTVVVDEGLLIAVGVDDGDDIDDVVIEQALDVIVAGAEGQPPCGVHGGGGAFALAAVDVGEHADAGLIFGGDVLVGDLEAPEVALLPGGTDGVEVGDVGVGLVHLGELRLKLGVGVAMVPVNVKTVGNLFGGVGANFHGEELSLFAAGGAGIVAAGGKPEHHNEGKTETENTRHNRLHFHFDTSFLFSFFLLRSA